MDTVIIKKQNGGARPGSGRKPLPRNTLPAIRMRAILDRVAEERFEKMITAQMDAAIGITTEKYDKDGDLEYKDLGPNTNAAKLILEYTMPKPEQKITHSGAVGVLHIVAALEGPGDDDNYGNE